MKKWIKWGLIWGSILYIFTMIIFPLIDGEQLTALKIVLGIPLWIALGLTVGYLLIREKHKN